MLKLIVKKKITIFSSHAGFRCQCRGAMGDRCEYELNECSSDPCAKESICVDEFDGYRCICDGTYWQGIHCTEVVPNCQRLELEKPCKNDADCYSCNLETFKVPKKERKAIYEPSIKKLASLIISIP